MRTCRVCGIEQLLSNFYANRYKCKDCQRVSDRQRYLEKVPNAEFKGKRPPAYFELANGDNGRRCSGCNEIKLLSEFRPDNSRPNLPYSRFCKPCENNKSSEWARDNRARHSVIVRHSQRKSTYGLTQEQYWDLLDSQDNECAVCHKDFRIPSSLRQDAISVDHNHINGAIRGLLCGSCNMALGCLKDDIGIVRNLLAYLESREDL